MGSRPLNRSKPNATRTNTSRLDQHCSSATVVWNQLIEDEASVQDIGTIKDIDNLNNLDNMDDTNQEGNGPPAKSTNVSKFMQLPNMLPISTQKKPLTRPCIKGYECYGY